MDLVLDHLANRLLTGPVLVILAKSRRSHVSSTVPVVADGVAPIDSSVCTLPGHWSRGVWASCVFDW